MNFKNGDIVGDSLGSKDSIKFKILAIDEESNSAFVKSQMGWTASITIDRLFLIETKKKKFYFGINPEGSFSQKIVRSSCLYESRDDCELICKDLFCNEKFIIKEIEIESCF